MKSLINYIVSGIIGNNNFSVEKETEEGRDIYEIKIDKEYIGKLIGKGGRTIKSIRNVVKIKAILNKKSVFVNVNES